MPEQPNLEAPAPSRPFPVFDTEIPVHAVQDKNATVVVTQTVWGTTATGSSKREPGDRKNPARAYKLALGRALKDLGEQIVREENRLLRQEIREAQRIHRNITLRRQQEAELALAEMEATREERETRARRFRSTPEAKRKIAERRKARASR